MDVSVEAVESAEIRTGTISGVDGNVVWAEAPHDDEAGQVCKRDAKFIMQRGLSRQACVKRFGVTCSMSSAPSLEGGVSSMCSERMGPGQMPAALRIGSLEDARRLG